MSFQSWMTSKKLDLLRQAAIDADLVTTPRPLLFAGIDKRWANKLMQTGIPQHDFDLAIHALNTLERLDTGQVPFEVWLANAVRQTQGLEENKVFAAALAELGAQAQGSRRIASADLLPERQERIVHEDDLLPITFLDGALAAARSVAKITVPRFDDGVASVLAGSGQPRVYFGTGWIVAPNLMLTNHHVIAARGGGEPPASANDFRQQGAAAHAWFDFDAENASPVDRSCVRVEAADATLDYALLRLKDAGDRQPLRIAAAPLQPDADGRASVNIVQHPRGGAKRIAVRNNVVTRIEPSRVRYFTDTEQGSSGSPVCTDRWQVVALHRAWDFIDGVTFNGKQTAWVNEGTPIHLVLAHLRNANPAVADEVAAAQQ